MRLSMRGRRRRRACARIQEHDSFARPGGRACIPSAETGQDGEAIEWQPRMLERGNSYAASPDLESSRHGGDKAFVLKGLVGDYQRARVVSCGGRKWRRVW